jgi:nitrite reductase/ring-hydroxylating ferredoxin subunit
MEKCDTVSACMGRREFLVKTGLVAGATILTISSVGAATFEDVVVPVAADSPLAKVGGFTVVESSAGKIIVIRAEEAKYVAYSGRCTHKRAVLGYDHAKKMLVCPSHGSKFDPASGKVTGGPAETDLKSYPAKAGDGSVTVAVTA